MLEPAIIIDQAEQFCAGGGRPGRRAHRGRRTTTASGFHRLQLLGERLILGQDLSAVDQMTAQLGIQLEQAVGNRCGLPLAQPWQSFAGTGHRLRGEPIAGGAGDQYLVGFDADPQAVLADQPGRERVVGGDQLASLVGNVIGIDQISLHQRLVDSL